MTCATCIPAIPVGVEGEHQQIARHRHRGTAHHHHPVDEFLTRIEATGWGMLVADHSAALLDPLDVGFGRKIRGEPHQERQHHAEREWEAEIVVGVFRPLRQAGERFRTDQWQQQVLAESDVEAREREHDETDRRHPMHEALKRVEAKERAPGASSLDPNRAADEIEQQERGEYSDDGDGTDPRQRHLMEAAPVAAGRLLERAGLLVGQRAAAGDPIHLLEQLLFPHRACGRIDGAVGILGFAVRWRESPSRLPPAAPARPRRCGCA